MSEAGPHDGKRANDAQAGMVGKAKAGAGGIPLLLSLLLPSRRVPSEGVILRWAGGLPRILELPEQ